MRRIFRTEIESDASPALLFFVGVVIACSAAATGAVAGFEYRDFLAREAERNKPLPVRKSAENPPRNILPCGSVKSFAQEWDRTCRARKAAI